MSAAIITYDSFLLISYIEGIGGEIRCGLSWNMFGSLERGGTNLQISLCPRKMMHELKSYYTKLKAICVLDYFIFILYNTMWTP